MNDTPHDKAPRVSIGMPVFNGMRYMERAVRSVFAQTFNDFELIIVDNASTDGSYEYAQSLLSDPRVRLDRNKENIGGVKNVLAVLSRARGDYFMWAGCDDFWEPEFIERLVAELDQHPDAGVAMSATRRIKEDGSSLEPDRFLGSDDPWQLSPFRLAMKMASPNKLNLFITGMFRRPLLQDLAPSFRDGGAPERILLTLLALHSRFRYVDEVLYNRQMHELKHEERYPNEAYARVAAMGVLGDIVFVQTLTASLLKSRVVPARRKVLIPLIAGQFAITRLRGRYERRQHLKRKEMARRMKQRRIEQQNIEHQEKQRLKMQKRQLKMQKK